MTAWFVTLPWDTGEREVIALEADVAPLIGMSLLWGSRVSFDAKAGGVVSVDRLT